MKIKPATVKGLGRAAWVAAAGVALLAVFLLYTQPEFMVAVADQVWSCF